MNGGTIEGRIVAVVDHGESDRIVHLVHPTAGRVSLIARRARGAGSRLVGIFEVGHRVRVERGRSSGGLWAVKDAEILTTVRRPREDLVRLALLGWFCEWTHALVGPDAGPNRNAELLDRALDVLEGDGRPGMATRLAFEAKALTFAGLAPRLVECARCGRPFEPGELVAFDHDGGGAAHRGGGQGVAVTVGHLHRIEALRRVPLVDTVGVDGVSGEARWLLARFASYHTGWGWRSETVLSEVEEVR